VAPLVALCLQLSQFGIVPSASKLTTNHSDENLDGGHQLYSSSNLTPTFIYTLPTAKSKWYLVQSERGETKPSNKQPWKENLA
jgi:hypothetical protein